MTTGTIYPAQPDPPDGYWGVVSTDVPGWIHDPTLTHGEAVRAAAVFRDFERREEWPSWADVKAAIAAEK